jgi:hypothetical protein
MPPPARSPRPYVLDYLHECNAAGGGLTFADIRISGAFVLATVLVHAKACRFDYMDDAPGVRIVCKALAEDLRDAVGRAVYFDLARGVVRIAT